MTSTHFTERDVAMKDSWSHGEDRRERGRVDRGVTRSRRSTSPLGRRQDSERGDKTRDRGVERSRPTSRHEDRQGERSTERRRPVSRSPERDSREEVRQRNRGRELLDTRKSKHSDDLSPATKRHKSRSPSRSHSHRKKSRRTGSQSPHRSETKADRSTRDHQDHSKSRRRSDDRKRSPAHDLISSKARTDNSSSHRPSEHRGRAASRGQHSPQRHAVEHRRRSRSPLQIGRHPRNRPRSPQSKEINHRHKGDSTDAGRRSPHAGRYEPQNRSRIESPRPSRSSRIIYDPPPRSRRGRDEYRPESLEHNNEQSVNSIKISEKRKPEAARSREGSTEHRGNSASSDSGAKQSRENRESSVGSGANTGDIDSNKMNGRGNFGHGGYHNPHQQMQAAFPLKPQYQGPHPIDTRYSQSPQHATPNHSYHGSPQAQSPYSAGRGGWGDQQPQFSPPHQYGPNFNAQGGYPPNGPQGQFYPQNHSPQYHTPTGPMQHQQFRGGQRGFRGNQRGNLNNMNSRGGFQGRGGGQFQNPQWIAPNNPNNQNNQGRPPNNHSGNATPHGNVTPQHGSSPVFHPPSLQNSPVQSQPAAVEEEDGDLFRPSKDLQVEDTSTKKPDEQAMPPPTRPPPTGPQSNKFSFAFKASSKPPPSAPKEEITQKLSTAGPFRTADQVTRDAPSRPIPTEPSSSRPRLDQARREPPPPRKIKKILRRVKERPTLPTEFAASDSVYFRKPGNESVVGSGTYGKVFKAIHVYTKALVALKKIRMEGERDGFPVTAVREIKLLQSLKHANIVNLQEVMVEKNDCFMVFEYLSHDLTGLLNHPSFKLEPAHKKHLAKQLFEGLDYLHKRGVLHRDIKAANILVSNEGQLKIADFGLARFYAKRKQLDYTNRVITIWYRSPELLLGETQYGAAVDIWSAACVLVEIFTRHAIFPGDGGEISQLEKIYAILGTPNTTDWPGLVDMAWFELLRPSAKRPNVFAEKYKDRVTPRAFELLESMFHYDPVKRPSAAAVLEHPYFTEEEPSPKQAIELQALEGDWHEFESKALRKENEKKEKEARRAQQKDSASREKEKKRSVDAAAEDGERDPKRQQLAPPAEAATAVA